MNAYLLQLPVLSSNFLVFTPMQPATASIEEAQRAERTIFTWLGVKHYKSYLKVLSHRPWLYQHSFRIQGANNLVNSAVKLYLHILVEDHCFCPHVQALSNLHPFAPCWCTAVGSAKQHPSVTSTIGINILSQTSLKKSESCHIYDISSPLSCLC